MRSSKFTVVKDNRKLFHTELRTYSKLKVGNPIQTDLVTTLVSGYNTCLTLQHMSQVITLVSRYNTCLDGKLTKTTNKVRGSKSIGILSHVVIFREKITQRSLSNTPERIVLTTRKDLN